MSLKELLKESEKLPALERIILAEKILHTIRFAGDEDMENGVREMHEEYKTNEELTIFTDMNFEDFYETR